MKCSRCQREAVIFQPYSGNYLCETHLIADIESRAKKEIRKYGGLKSGEILYVSNGNAMVSFALRVFLSGLLLKRVDISFSSEEADADTIVSPSCLEEIAETVLTAVLKGNPEQFLLHQKKRILQPFAGIPRKEIEIYATNNGWCKGGETQTSEIDAFLTSFSKKRPSARFALKNVKESLEKMI
ncbi:MAG TPA: hypothetical protein O0X32_01040 [Methanocorpusculum sp.]|nr:hypothetical protein [Methanocorpusculum sp.]